MNRQPFWRAIERLHLGLLVDTDDQGMLGRIDIQPHKAGGQWQRLDLSHLECEIQAPSLDLIALDAALHEFEAMDGRAAALVKLRFFAGLTMSQAALALGVSLATVENDWAYAKCWLRLQMSESP